MAVLLFSGDLKNTDYTKTCDCITQENVDMFHVKVGLNACVAFYEELQLL